MRDVAEYQANAVEFDPLAASATDEALKKRYADLAECYRLLASERQRLINEGALPSKGSP
jgi:hypothetical protein